MTDGNHQEVADELMKPMPRNDSEYSLGLNRSEPAGLRDLGKPCFYSWPGVMADILRDSAGSVIVGVCLAVVVKQISHHRQHHQVDK